MKLSTILSLVVIFSIISFNVVDAKKKKGDSDESEEKTEEKTASRSEEIEDGEDYDCKCGKKKRATAVCGSNKKVYKNECIFKCVKENSSDEKEQKMKIIKCKKKSKKGKKGKKGDDDEDSEDEEKGGKGDKGVVGGVPVKGVELGGKKKAKKGSSSCERDCPSKKKQVCGTDGETYDNRCLLNCQTKKKSKTKFDFNGACDQGKTLDKTVPDAGGLIGG